MKIELPEWIRLLKESNRVSFIDNGEKWFATTVRKQPLRKLSEAKRETLRVINDCEISRYTFSDGMVYQEQVQAKMRRNSEEVLFLVLEKGSGEHWDTLEETVWTQKEMERYLVFVCLLRLHL